MSRLVSERLRLAVALLAGILSFVVPATTADDCTNINGDMFLNKCLKDSSGILWMLAQFIGQWLNPRTFAISTVTMIIVLPALMMLNNHPSWYLESRRKFYCMRLILLHFLHRIGYSLVLVVGLYAVFRQSRPCSCLVSQVGYARVGSRFGMPSGDALAGGIVGAFLIDRAPFFKVGSRIGGLILIACICGERVILGYHTVGQVIAGASLGCLLHFYSTRVPQWVLLVDTAIQWIAGPIALKLADITYSDNDPNNLLSWFVWGMSFQLFFVMMIIMHFFKRNGGLGMLRLSYVNITESTMVETEIEEQLFLNTELFLPRKKLNSHTEARTILRDSDILFTLLALSCLAIVNFLSSCIQRYNWLVTISNHPD